MRSRYLLNALTAKLYYFHSRESLFMMLLLFNIVSHFRGFLSGDLLRFFTRMGNNYGCKKNIFDCNLFSKNLKSIFFMKYLALVVK